MGNGLPAGRWVPLSWDGGRSETLLRNAGVFGATPLQPSNNFSATSRTGLLLIRRSPSWESVGHPAGGS